MLGAETELAILAVLAISDQTVLILEDLATLRTQLQVLSGPEWGACSRKIRNLEEAVAVQRERLRQIGGEAG